MRSRCLEAVRRTGQRVPICRPARCHGGVATLLRRRGNVVTAAWQRCYGGVATLLWARGNVVMGPWQRTGRYIVMKTRDGETKTREGKTTRREHVATNGYVEGVLSGWLRNSRVPLHDGMGNTPPSTTLPPHDLGTAQAGGHTYTSLRHSVKGSSMVSGSNAVGTPWASKATTWRSKDVPSGSRTRA